MGSFCSSQRAAHLYPTLLCQKIKVWRARPVQSQKDPQMAISSAIRSPTTLTINRTLWFMQKRALKQSVKRRECLIKGVAKGKKSTPISKKDCSCWDSNLSLGCTILNTVLHRIFTEIQRIYSVYTPYNTYRFLIRKTRYVDPPPPCIIRRIYRTV